MKKFVTYQLAKELYRDITCALKVNRVVGARRDQLDRAALSVALNLAEGSAKPTAKERKRFYFIALGSFRETQALIDLCDFKHLEAKADKLGAHLYKLCHA